MKFLTQAAKVRNEQKKHRRRLAVFLCLAVIVALGTAAGLKMYGQAMSHKQKKLVCPYEVHQHTDECYGENGELVCGQADYVVHIHNDDCYEAGAEGEEKKLVCQLPEIEAHVHTEECYTEQEVLVCTEDGAEVHEHTESCYTPERGELQCQLEEHQHGEECYDENGELVCQLEEHQHNDSCYTWNEVLTCTLGEHQHTEECYTREKRELQCQLEEHQHDEACYDENGELVCQLEEHQHDDNCYAWEDVLTCQLEENNGGHVHGEECYEMQKVLTCGQLELHSHDESCYDENGALVCGMLELREHVHGEECFETIELSDEEVMALKESETKSVSEDETGSHIHDESCYDAASGLICGYNDVETEEPEITKTYENEKYIVTAVYHEDANIPEDAELAAEMITAESDGDHYAQRETELKEALNDNDVKMDALFKIGFYKDDEEIEPESDVMITVQFLDENGMAEGVPMTVVHFAESGSEVLGGSHVKDRSTTFKTNNFSEFGLVSDYETSDTAEQAEEVEEYTSIAGHINLSESTVYQDENYNITFHITGKAAVPAGVAASLNEISKGTVSSDRITEITEDSEIEEPEAESESGEESALENDETTEEQPSDLTEAGAADAENTEGSISQSGNTSSNQPENTAEKPEIEFKVDLVDKNSSQYKAVNDYAQQNSKGSTELLLDVLTYSVTYGDVELDVSDCEVTAEVKPTEALLKQAARKENMQAAEEGEKASNTKDNVSVVFTLMRISNETEINEIDELDIDKSTVKETKSYTVSTEEAEYFAARASSQPNPKFTVQYYANLEVVAYNDPTLRKVISGTSYTNELPVIDTTGGRLPVNGKGTTASPNENEIRNLYVDMSTGKLQTKTELTEVYSSRPFEYHKAPTINYMNALIENPGYKLKQVWVLKEGKKADSTEEADWDIHQYNSNLHFTNREVSAESGEYVLISDGATLRFVYDTTTNDKNFESAFYDYDIGDGKIYSSQANAQNQQNGKNTSQQGTGTNYMHTKQSGINSPSNYTTSSGTKLAFGNASTGSGLQYEQWSGNLLNKYNGTQSGHPSVTGSYKGCTFELVTGLADGKIQYAKNVNVPNLFNDGNATGKTSYDNGQFSLTFNRVGDTHTLTAVNGTGANGLDSFNHPSPNSSTVHNHIWTNNFWPMDSAKSFGTDGHDMKFGDYDNRENYKFAGQAGSNGGSAAANGIFPWSDDGVDHNSYFGMHYTVEFELVKDYVGPLEYYFFGDDDMWVFLDGRLICDIGGVHSSVGEYVNLWDYLAKGSSGKHTLNFFYTERGQSGSTCWMQFTLPSVSSLTPETVDEDYGQLKIEKTVTQINDDEQTIIDNNDEFTFTVHFTDKDGNNLPDDYSYVKYDKNDNEIGADLIIWDGGTFTLKNGEYIIVKYLPEGTKYEITESNAACTVTDNTSETSKTEYFTDITVGNTPDNNKKDLDDQKKAEGDIPKADIAEVKYNNKFYIYELPETGGPGNLPLYTTVLLLIGATALIRYKQLRYRREGGKK